MRNLALINQPPYMSPVSHICCHHLTNRMLFPHCFLLCQDVPLNKCPFYLFWGPSLYISFHKHLPHLCQSSRPYIGLPYACTPFSNSSGFLSCEGPQPVGMMSSYSSGCPSVWNSFSSAWTQTPNLLCLHMQAPCTL